MLVPRKDNPKKKEWIDEYFVSSTYKILERGDGYYDIYCGSELYTRADSREEAIQIAEELEKAE